MKTILDTNVVLDVLLDRKPFVDPASRIFALAEQSTIEGFLCATTVTTVNYLLRDSLSAANARETLRTLLNLFEVAVVNRAVIESALRSQIADFEDAVIEESGRVAGAECIVSRNTKDFRRASLKVFDPVEFLLHLGQ